MTQDERTPARKLLTTTLVALLLAVPLLGIYVLAYDRQMQSDAARDSISKGWGGPQLITSPILAIFKILNRGCRAARENE